MANSGSFRKGQKRPNQGKHGPPRASLAAREAIARFVEGNTGKLQEWLDQIAEKEGPKAAFQCFVALLDYHVPKLARQELVGREEGPITICWKEK
jgi:hypothetical protein